MKDIFSEKNLLRAIKIGLYSVFLTAFLTFQKFMFPFITTKASAFNIIIELIFALWLVLAAFFPKYRPKANFLNISILVFLAAIFLSSAFGIDFHRSFWSTQERATGLFFILHLAAFYLTLSVFSKDEFKNYLKASFIVSLVISAFAIVQYYNPGLILSGGSAVGDRAGSFFGNPIFLAAYLLFNIFISLWFFAEEFFINKNKVASLWFAAGSLFELGIVVLATQTRGAILGLMAGLLGVLLYFSFNNLEYAKILKKISLSVLAAAVLFSGAFLLTRHSPAWQKIPGFDRVATISLSDSTTQTRLITWGVAVKSFQERPILGFGWENFKYPFDKNYDPRLLKYGFSETYWDKPHNIIFEYLVNIGIIGLLSYLGVILGACYIAAKKTAGKAPDNFDLARPFILGALIAYFAQNLVAFDTFGPYIMFFIFLAFLNKISEGDIQDAKPESKKTIVLLPILAAAVFISGAYANISVLNASNAQFWFSNYFINQAPDQALAAYAQTQNGFNPYADSARRDFLDVSVQMYGQNILPEPEKNLVKAVAAGEENIKTNPNDYYNYFDLADKITDIYNSSGIFSKHPEMLSKAENAIKQAIAISPNRQENYYGLAKLDIVKGNKQAAADAFAKAASLAPDVGDPYFFYGLLLLEAGDIQGGFKELDRAYSLGREPKTAREYKILANFYGDAGQYDKSIDYYKGAINLDPEDIDARFKLGLVYYYSHNYRLAKLALADAISRTPGFKGSSTYNLIKPVLDSLGL